MLFLQLGRHVLGEVGHAQLPEVDGVDAAVGDPAATGREAEERDGAGVALCFDFLVEWKDKFKLEWRKDSADEQKKLTSSPKSSSHPAPPVPSRTGSVTRRSTAIRTLTSCTVPGSRPTEKGVESDDGPDRTVTGEDDLIRSM